MQAPGYMPVIQKTEPEVAQTVAAQPAPAVDPAKLTAAQARVDKYKKRVKCTSYTLMIVGVLGMIGSLYAQFNARHVVSRVA